MALVGYEGRVVDFQPTPGNNHEVKHVDAVLNRLAKTPGALLTDRPCQSKELRARLAADGIEAVIPSTSTVKRSPPCDMDVYKTLHLVENVFADVKRFRGIATRYCKFTAMLRLAFWFLATTPIRRRALPHSPV